MQEQHYIKLILPLRLEWEPCYISATPLSTGDRVAVIFAGRRTVGVVSEIDVVPDIDPSRIHSILSVETGLERISPEEIAFWRFIADYYLCSVGEVYKAAYPNPKTASEEIKARSTLRKQQMALRSEELWKQRIARLEARLDARNADLARNHGEAVRLRIEAQRERIIAELEEAQRRLASLSLQLPLAEGDWSALIAALPTIPPDPLLKNALKPGKPLLLKSSRRNAYYMGAADECLRNGKNVCILVNEIALAGELRGSLESCFGDLLLVHHSQMTRREQRGIMEAMRSGRPYVLIGTRSSVFLPHRDLGLIIVENEESVFYKQSDTAPRYNARDCAVQLSRIHGCPIILGSASPSLESILNAQTGRYSLLDCSSGGRELHPECRVTIVDVLAERNKNGMQGAFSRILLKAMQKSGRTALIRGFEKPEDLDGVQADIFTIPQAAKTDLSGYGLVAMLSADALFNPADFRSDEHAFQYLERLRCICPELIVQTRQAGHQVFTLNTAEHLLEERRRFALPPYSRLVDLHAKDAAGASALSQALENAGFNPAGISESTVRITLQRNSQLQGNKRKLRNTLEAFRRSSKSNVVIDVDPS